MAGIKGMKKGETKKDDPPKLPDLDKIDFGDLKLCPNCKLDRPKKPTIDPHKHYRCYCPTCNFWESVVSLTPEAAAEKWNAAGGPDRP